MFLRDFTTVCNQVYSIVIVNIPPLILRKLIIKLNTVNKCATAVVYNSIVMSYIFIYDNYFQYFFIVLKKREWREWKI